MIKPNVMTKYEERLPNSDIGKASIKGVSMITSY